LISGTPQFSFCSEYALPGKRLVHTLAFHVTQQII